MSQVVVTIAGRTYRMSCEDGQEAHLEALARDVDARMAVMKTSFGEIGDQRLAMMTALTIADELDAARRAATAAQERAQAQAAIDAARIAALEAALDRAADRVRRVTEALIAGGQNDPR